MLESNKRKDEGVSSRFVIRYRPSGQEHAWNASTLRDISVTGCQFTAVSGFSKGQLLDIELKLPAEPLISIKANVARCEPDPYSNLSFIGVSFLGLAPEKLKKVKQVIEFIVRIQKN